ncbi:MAG: hypothetical protein ACI89L_002531 [Phycisphaerales bacterium]|jgi:hypothetical protein
MSWKARFLWAFLVSIALTVLAALTAILFDSIPFQEEVIFSSLLFAVHALAGLVGAVLWQRKPARRMVILGVGLVLLGGIGWITLVWMDELNVLGWRGERWMARGCSTATIPGLAFMVRALVLWPTNRNKQVRALSVACWVLGAFGAVLSLIGIWGNGWWDDELLVKLLASAFTISAGCGVGVFVVARLTMGDLIEHEDSGLGNRAPVKLDCPRCGCHVELRANTQGQCPGCDLKLRVELEEPRCVCGYLLHGLTGEVCPECGRKIGDQKGWGASPNPSLGDGEAPPRAEGD